MRAVPGRCVVSATAQAVWPYREPDAVAGHRRRLLHRASGRVLDVSPDWAADRACLRPGAIEALSVLHGPVARAAPPEWADDPLGEPQVLRADLDRLARAPASVDGAWDTVVACTALCTASAPERVLAGATRWLAPGGVLLVLQHVLGTGLTGLAQRAAGPWQRAGASCHLALDVADLLRRSGWQVTDAARFTSRTGGVAVPWLAAVARPAGAARPGAATVGLAGGRS